MSDLIQFNKRHDLTPFVCGARRGLSHVLHQVGQQPNGVEVVATLAQPLHHPTSSPAEFHLLHCHLELGSNIAVTGFFVAVPNCHPSITSVVNIDGHIVATMLLLAIGVDGASVLLGGVHRVLHNFLLAVVPTYTLSVVLGTPFVNPFLKKT